MSLNRAVRGRLPAVHPLVLALAALSATPAFAQESTDATTRAPAVLDTLQVTAQRRVENAKDVPVSITTLSGEKLDVLGSGILGRALECQIVIDLAATSEGIGVVDAVAEHRILLDRAAARRAHQRGEHR